MIGDYGSYGVLQTSPQNAFGRVSRKSPLSVWKARCEAIRAAKAAGKKQFDRRNIDLQEAEWCSRESEWKAEALKRQGEVDLIQSAADTDPTNVPDIETILAQTKTGTPILPIIAFLAIAGIGGFILYRRGK